MPRRLAALAFLGSCASLSDEQCLEADWRRIGAADGAAGRQPARLEQHREACSDVGVVPDAAAWERGRQQGLPLYCTPERAYEEGARGRSFSPVCPAAERTTLSRANCRGLAYHEAQEDIRQIEADLWEIDRLLTRLPARDPRRARLHSARARLLTDLLSARLDLLGARP